MFDVRCLMYDVKKKSNFQFGEIQYYHISHRLYIVHQTSYIVHYYPQPLNHKHGLNFI